MGLVRLGIDGRYSHVVPANGASSQLNTILKRWAISPRSEKAEQFDHRGVADDTSEITTPLRAQMMLARLHDLLA